MQSRKIQLRASPEQAEELVPFWGKSVQVTAKVRYNDKLEIVDGDLLDWSPLDEETSAIDALREIFLDTEQ